MTFPQYLDQMGTNKEKFVQFLSEITVRPEDRAALGKLGRTLNILVITEDWCGDALYNVPVLAKLVEGNPNIEMRVFLRDKNPDLMDQYLNQGIYRSIPVFAFFDENMDEVARLIERARALAPAPTDAGRDARPDLRRRGRRGPGRPGHQSGARPNSRPPSSARRAIPGGSELLGPRPCAADLGTRQLPGRLHARLRALRGPADAGRHGPVLRGGGPRRAAAGHSGGIAAAEHRGAGDIYGRDAGKRADRGDRHGSRTGPRPTRSAGAPRGLAARLDVPNRGHRAAAALGPRGVRPSIGRAPPGRAGHGRVARAPLAAVAAAGR